MLWTRLAPEPLSSNPETPGGMSSGDVTIAYEIATDDAMRLSPCDPFRADLVWTRLQYRALPRTTLRCATWTHRGKITQ